MFALLQTCRAQCARRQRKPPTSPSTGWRLAQSSIVPYRKRPARAPHCRAAGRRHDDIEVVTQIGPVAEHLEFANIARSFNTDVLRHSGERLLAEWLAPQNHEHHIVRHEAQYSLQFAVCRSPAALAFIQVETRSGWRLRRGTSRVLLHPMKIDHRYRSATSPSRSTSQARSMAPRAPTERSAAKAWPVSHRVLKPSQSDG